MPNSCHQSRCHYARGYKFILSLVARLGYPFHKPHNEGIINATVSLRNRFIFQINLEKKLLKLNTLGRFRKHKTHANKNYITNRNKHMGVCPFGLSFEVANQQNLEDPTWFQQRHSKIDGEGVQKSNCKSVGLRGLATPMEWGNEPPNINHGIPVYLDIATYSF